MIEYVLDVYRQREILATIECVCFGGAFDNLEFNSSANSASDARAEEVLGDRNLVDPASSHMLVSKIKPCKSQHKSSHDEAANGSLKQL